MLLLVGVIALFLSTVGARLNVEPAAPIEDLRVERTVLRPNEIELHIRNVGPDAVTIAQAVVNEAVWPFEAGESGTVARLGNTVVRLAYPWVHGEPYTVRLFTANAVPFESVIQAAAVTPTVGAGTLWNFTLIGLFVGVIPVFLGIFWFPALKRLGAGALAFMMALTVGLLLFLGVDALGEALEVAGELGGPFQGVGLVALGFVLTFLLLDAVGRRQAAIGRSESSQRLAVAYMIALGIGLHNLGEGLAIGASYSIGAVTLGTFLVVGFILQNITEGLGIIAPVLRDRPPWRDLVLLGVIGGAPAIVGTWIGGISYWPPLATLFLAIGAGAVLEVVYEMYKLIQRDTKWRAMPLTLLGGVTAGMLLLYVTGLMIK